MGRQQTLVSAAPAIPPTTCEKTYRMARIQCRESVASTTPSVTAGFMWAPLKHTHARTHTQKIDIHVFINTNRRSSDRQVTRRY